MLFYISIESMDACVLQNLQYLKNIVSIWPLKQNLISFPLQWKAQKDLLAGHDTWKVVIYSYKGVNPKLKIQALEILFVVMIRQHDGYLGWFEVQNTVSLPPV